MDFQRRVSLGLRSGLKSQRVGLSRLRSKSSVSNDYNDCHASPQESVIHKRALFKPSVQSTPIPLRSEMSNEDTSEPSVSPARSNQSVAHTESLSHTDISPIGRPNVSPMFRPRTRPTLELGMGLHTTNVEETDNCCTNNIQEKNIKTSSHNLGLHRPKNSQKCSKMNTFSASKALKLKQSQISRCPLDQNEMLSLNDSIFELVGLEETEYTDRHTHSQSEKANPGLEFGCSSPSDYSPGEYFTGAIMPRPRHSQKSAVLATEIISAREALIRLSESPQSLLDQSKMLSQNESIFEQVDLGIIGEPYHHRLSNTCSIGNSNNHIPDMDCNTISSHKCEHIVTGTGISVKGDHVESRPSSSATNTKKVRLNSYQASPCRKSIIGLDENAEKREFNTGTKEDSGIEIGLQTSSPKADTIAFSPPSSLIPMGEQIRRALVTNAQKPAAIKPQQTLVFRLDILGSSSNVENNCPGSPALSDVTQSKSQFFDLGPFFGLPSQVKTLVQQFKGIDDLYPWQKECLNLPALKQRKNLVYALPTSGGKTLVAEVLMFRELLCCKKNAIFILPFVSIVQEKVRALASFGLALNFLVEEYASSKGMYPPRKRRRKQSVYVCTIEKALGLTNSLIETKRLSEIGLVVVDELHLVGDSSGRGANLEGLLTKIMFVPEPIQIVGMSATIGNLDEIATFLKAETYTQNFRPVELKEYIKLKNSIYIVNSSATTTEEMFTLSRTLDYPYTAKMLAIDPDMLAGLVMEVIPNNSCLVFCATKQNCENVALLICRLLPQELFLKHKMKEKNVLCDTLRADGNGSICSILSKTLPFGVAYHHAGLTGDERRLLEEAYLATTICCICCTSTLAAGVNLPAKRVILRSPYIGRDFIDISHYKQMVGRAGRAGLGDSGESILVCKPEEAPRVGKLMLSQMNKVNSGLHLDNSQGMRNLVLSAIGLGIAKNRDRLHHLATHTLLNVQAEELGINIFDVTDSAITTLLKLNAIRTSDTNPDCSILNSNVSVCMSGGSGDELINSPRASIGNHSTCAKLTVPNNNGKRVTVRRNTELLVNKLGQAALKGSIELSKARVLLEDLRQAQRSLVCVSHLHLLYLITPYDLSEQVKMVNSTFFSALNELDEKDSQTAHILGINEAAMTSLMRGKKVKGVAERVIRRFYVTLMLKDLWNQKSAWEVATKFDMPRGFVQNLMSSSAAFSSCVVRFCEELEEMWAFKDLFGNFTQRLAHCCSVELLPLMELPAVKRGRAKQLYNAGFKSLKDVAQADPRVLISLIEPLSKRVAYQIIAAAKLLLVEMVETLREEAEDVLDGFLNIKDVEEWMSGTALVTEHPTQ